MATGRILPPAVKTPRLRFLLPVCALSAALSISAFAADSGAGSTGTSGSSGSDSSSSNNNNSSSKDDKKPHTIFLLDGSALFGKVELTDDYTLKVSSDSGIQKIPLALLGQSDFKKYGFSKDRSKDGKFWSDRNDAVNDQQKKDDSKGNKDSGDSSQLQVSLTEILPFQGLISSYKKDNPKKDDSSGSDQKDKTASNSGSGGGQGLPFQPLFSQPGMSSLPTAPLNGLGSGGGLPSAPGTSLLPSPTGGLPGLPTSP